MIHWRQNPQRVAWIVLTVNFLLCCTLTAAGPFWLRNEVLHATRYRLAKVAAVVGTAQLLVPGADEPVAVTAERTVPEGSQIVTDGATRSLLTIAQNDPGQQPLATVQLFQDTALHLERSRTPRFPSLGSDPDRISLVLERGRMAILNTPLEGRTVEVSVTTPQGRIIFNNGSYYITVADNESQFTARSGSGRVLAEGGEVTAHSGERVVVKAGRAPALPVPAALNLVLNGRFESGLGRAWEEVVQVLPGLQAGEVVLESAEQGRVVRFVRRTEDGAPSMVGIRQVLNTDVQGYESLVLRFDLQLLYQSVPGGGYLSSEYPLMVDVAYTDIYGKDLHWYQGFYCQDLPSGSAFQPPTGERIPIGAWYTYESPDLLEAFPETRPARINSITFYASGHDYESRLSDVVLTVR